MTVDGSQEYPNMAEEVKLPIWPKYVIPIIHPILIILGFFSHSRLARKSILAILYAI
jgi:hypothetical protein